MEEILASIRRIISEDDQPAEEGAPVAAPEPPAAAAPPPAPEPEPEPEPVAAAPEPEPEPEEDEEPLELTQRVETVGDLDVMAPEPEPEPPPVAVAPEPEPAPTLVSEHVAAAAAASFSALSANILMPSTDRTLEDVVRELLRPLLQQWLDANLPAIVQEAVQAEVERIARGRVR